MELRSKIMMSLAALLLGGLFILPFWTINMSAPQYPEGIGMHIHIDNVSGHNKHDLRSINSLNHYIGMKEIHKEDFPEFKVMPWVIGFLMVFGLIAAASGNMKLVYVWIVLLIILAIIGFIDFYMWGYDYGHNLNPDAAIKVPGMTYQPPLLGCKQLLNINACSWPTTGSIFIGLSVLLVSGVVWNEKKQK